MRNKFLVLSALVSFVLVSAALAGPVWKVALTSTDAGTTNTGSIAQQRDYIIQCNIPACFRTGASTVLTADCSTDFVLRGLRTTMPTDGGLFGESITGDYQSFAFKSGQDTKIAARALDGGNPACDVYLDKR